MHLQSLSLTNFKNIARAELSLSPKLNCFLGDNGMGKSNLLDAVYFMSFCKSFTGMTDAMLVRTGEDFMMMSGVYERRGVREELAVGLNRGRRKSFRRGGKEYQRLSSHIGLFPLVMISPSDMSLVDGTGEDRRRFTDQIISQTDAQYLDMLIRYNKALEQRNSMLRHGETDACLYGAVEMTLDRTAEVICRTRRAWVERLAEIFGKYYEAVAGEGDVPTLSYRSHLQEGGPRLTEMLDRERLRDTLLKHTTVGPHRDDLEMTLHGMPVRRTASQGQAKTYVVALRLAQYDFLREKTGMKPLLLLDDVFDKLDAGRVERIMSLVSGDRFGQIFITDTHRKHLDEILARAAGEYTMWNVADGVFTPIHPGEEAGGDEEA